MKLLDAFKRPKTPSTLKPPRPLADSAQDKRHKGWDLDAYWPIIVTEDI